MLKCKSAWAHGMSITAGCACEKVDRVANQQVPTGTMNGMRRQFVLPVGRR